MKTYLVGGAVRDELLELPVKDRDWVVTGATPEQMMNQGFRPVGQDFPVFLHPKTKEEYALARTEKKSGHGYAGFTFFTSPTITLEEDLLRRDLTINAIAKDESGNLIDPYSGQQDMENRILRHVSPAFREDPLRILRVARFAARFSNLGFSVAAETQNLMREMVNEGEAEWLVAERVWQETCRALTEADPARYFQELNNVGALAVVMPEITDNFSDLKTLSHKALLLAQENKAENEVRFACATCTFKQQSLDNMQKLCKRMKLPKPYKEVCELTAKLISYWKEDAILLPSARLEILQTADGFRRPERFNLIIKACSLLAKAAGLDSVLGKQLEDDLNRSSQINIKKLVDQGFKGKELAQAIKMERLKVLSD